MPPAPAVVVVAVCVRMNALSFFDVTTYPTLPAAPRVSFFSVIDATGVNVLVNSHAAPRPVDITGTCTVLSEIARLWPSQTTLSSDHRPTFVRGSDSVTA